MKLLSRSEELILLAVWRLQEGASGLAVRRHLISESGHEWSIGSVYVPLDKLVKLGYLTASKAAPTQERGGRSKRLFTLTHTGVGALNEVRQLNETMWRGLPELSVEKL